MSTTITIQHSVGVFKMQASTTVYAAVVPKLCAATYFHHNSYSRNRRNETVPSFAELSNRSFVFTFVQ